DHQEPPVQLPPDRRELLRRCIGASKRNHLQRRLDAAGLRAAGACTAPRSTSGRGSATRTRPRAGSDESGRRTVRTDGATGRWIMRRITLHSMVIGLVTMLAIGLSGCEWRGLNSLPMPGTEG